MPERSGTALPLDPDFRRMLIHGPNADDLRAIGVCHDYHCGCASPGDRHICVCQPVASFKVLRDA